jgi:hypothetical protein
MRERMDNHDMDTQQEYSSVKPKLLKLSPAPGEEEILVKTQQMPTIEGEIGRVPRVAFSGFVVDEMDNLNRVRTVVFVLFHKTHTCRKPGGWALRSRRM